MLDPEHPAGAGKAGLDLVGDQQHAVFVAQRAQGGHEAGRGLIEPAFALDRLDDDRGNVGRIDIGLEQAVERGKALRFADPVVFDREGHVPDIAGEGAEPGLVGLDLAGQRHAHHGPAVEPALERDHRLAPGMGPGDLDRVLDRLGPGGDEDRLRWLAGRGDRVEPFGQLDIGAVGVHLERGVGEPVHLFLDRGNHPRVVVPGVEHRDPAGEIDVAVAFDVPQLGVERAFDKARVHGRNPARDGLFAAGLKFGIAGHGNRFPFGRGTSGRRPGLDRCARRVKLFGSHRAGLSEKPIAIAAANPIGFVA